MRRKKSALNYILPIAIATMLLALLAVELMNRQNLFFSASVNEQLPAFSAPDLWLANSTFSSAEFKDKVVLLNVWASWCPSCRSENPMLLSIQQSKAVPIYSLVYKDEAADAKSFLSTHGNPYVKSGLDNSGAIAKKLRVYGTPETFLIDKHGMIRYRQIGVIDDEAWLKVLLPLINQYKMEN